MANSFLNIIVFLITTLIYYLIKPKINLDIINDTEKYKKYMKTNYIYLAIYILLVIVVQFIINASIITNTCGGSISENMGAAGLITFIPWTLIFGSIIIVILLFPGFKSAFSDVIGYYYVSSSANKLLSDLLINQEVNKILHPENEPQQLNTSTDNTSTPVLQPVSPQENEINNKEPNITGGNTKRKIKGGNNTNIDEQKLQQVASAIVKICGNTSVLINQIVPLNFNKYWEILKPLIKPEYRDDKQKQTDLFDLVVTRDNIGEAMWYIYTGILLAMIVQLKIVTRGCVNSVSTMQQNYQTYLKNEQATQASQDAATSTVYTVT